MSEVRIIKQLRSQLNTMLDDAKVLKIESANIQRQYSEKQNAIEKLNLEINKLNFKTDKIKVSEHAILRYLERVKGLDINAIEKEILNDKVLGLINTLGGNGTFPSYNFSVLMKNNTVTTVITF
jgi:hypothetical protein